MVKSGMPLRILFADDDNLVSEIIQSAIVELGHHLIGKATNGEEAVRMTEELKPDIILMDIGMPGMDGLEASRIIQDNTPVPIVVLTAYESQDFVRKASEAGAGAYLVKPPKVTEIQRAVTIAMARHEDLMKLRQLNQELEFALKEIKTLRGILPICANCKKVRDDDGYWKQIDIYLQEHTEADLSHGICPECMKKLYSDFADNENG